MNKEDIPTLEEYTELVKKLFINNCLQKINELEKRVFIQRKRNNILLWQ